MPSHRLQAARSPTSGPAKKHLHCFVQRAPCTWRSARTCLWPQGAFATHIFVFASTSRAVPRSLAKFRMHGNGPCVRERSHPAPLRSLKRRSRAARAPLTCRSRAIHAPLECAVRTQLARRSHAAVRRATLPCRACATHALLMCRWRQAHMSLATCSGSGSTGAIWKA